MVGYRTFSDNLARLSEQSELGTDQPSIQFVRVYTATSGPQNLSPGL